MDKLIFLSNEIMNPSIHTAMRIPLHFISFAHIKGKMYKHFGNRSTFTLPIDVNKSWGNDVAYGAVFVCKDFDFYARILDAYFVCSMTTMLRNHNQDLHHRFLTEATLLQFNTLEELATLKYKEGEPIDVLTYMGNLKHPKISQRLNKTISYRITDGIDKDNFKKLFWEVKKWENS